MVLLSILPALAHHSLRAAPVDADEDDAGPGAVDEGATSRAALAAELGLAVAVTVLEPVAVAVAEAVALARLGHDGDAAAGAVGSTEDVVRSASGCGLRGCRRRARVGAHRRAARARGARRPDDDDDDGAAARRERVSRRERCHVAAATVARSSVSSRYPLA